SLWTGGDGRTLRVEDGQLRIGLQHVTPPVMVEYGPEWGLQAITMEDAPRQFGLDDPANVRADVDRCTAFDDEGLRGGWCALPVVGGYGPVWGLQAIPMEAAPRQFGLDDPANVRAYVDRCTAFDDEGLRGEWCALLVDADNNMKLFAGDELRDGVRVDAPLE